MGAKTSVPSDYIIGAKERIASLEEDIALLQTDVTNKTEAAALDEKSRKKLEEAKAKLLLKYKELESSLKTCKPESSSRQNR